MSDEIGDPPEPRLPAHPSPSSSVVATLARPLAVGFALTLGGLLALALALALSNLSSVLIMIVLALFLALGLDPVVAALEKRGAGRGRAILIVSAVGVVVFGGVLALLVPVAVRQLLALISDLPATIDAFMVSDTYRRLEAVLGDGLTAGLGQFEELLVDPGTLAAIGGGVLQVSFGIVGGLSGAIIVFVLTLYFTASLVSMKQAFYRLAPAWSRPQVSDLTERITRSVGAYLKGMIILAFLNSIVVLVLHLALRLPFPELMALGAFLITIVPLVGSALFWILASLLALFTSPATALIFFVVYFIYMETEAYVLTPRVMKRAIAVPGPLVVIGALVGGTLLGLLGALVAVPVTASILLIIKELVVPHQDAKLVREID